MRLMASGKRYDLIRYFYFFMDRRSEGLILLTKKEKTEYWGREKRVQDSINVVQRKYVC